MGPNLPPRATTLPVHLRYMEIAQEAYPTSDQTGNSDYLWVVPTVAVSEKVEAGVPLPP